MRLTVLPPLLGLVAAFAAPALAQNADASLAYRDGIVYDDDLVPDARPDQPYFPPTSRDLSERRDGATVYGYGYGYSDGGSAAVPANSPQLIGPDGRIRAPR